MNAPAFKTRAEQRLEQLEALQRPLTRGESGELRRCLHAIYMRNWRVEQAITGRRDPLDIQKAAQIETSAIATRMVMATDEGWPEAIAAISDHWQDAARAASARLLAAIQTVAVREALR